MTLFKRMITLEPEVRITNNLMHFQDQVCTIEVCDQFCSNVCSFQSNTAVFFGIFLFFGI